jgi:hypothetical protein
MRIVFVVILSFLLSPMSAQDLPKPAYTLTARAHYGFVWNFSKDISHLATQHMPAFELNLTGQTRGAKPWHQEYRYPQIGYSLYYFSFDPQKPLGNSIALVVHAGKAFYRTARTSLFWRVGCGPAWVNKRFDTHTNYRNNMISARLNFTLNGQLNFQYHLSRRMLVNLGVGLIHISNGSLKKPNFGINLPTVHAGIGVNLSEKKDYHRYDSLPVFRRKTQVHLAVATGWKEVYPVNGPKYSLLVLNGYVERRVNRKSGVHIGADFSYDDSKRAEIRNDATLQGIDNVPANYMQAGVLLGHELYLHRLSLLTQLGVYLYDPTHLSRPYYQKFGLKYYLTEKCYVNMTMKNHLGVADWVEWGVGFRL